MTASRPSKLLFIGDSITDCDRARPIGEGNLGEKLGNGYVRLVDALLTATVPDHPYRCVNMGVSGDTVRELKERWQTDVVALQPDALVIMIGINDVWRHFSRPLNREAQISHHEFRETLDELLRSCGVAPPSVMLMAPYFIEPDRNEPMRVRMDSFGDIVRDLAGHHGTTFVDTQRAFDAVLRYVHPMRLANDRVHPNWAGHAIIARALIASLGLAIPTS
jgi:lysophospholipase L1-like esterase